MPPPSPRRKREAEFLAEAKAQAVRRDASHGLLGKCLACVSKEMLPNGLPGDGTFQAYNHCIPRSRLPGERHWPLLHHPANLAPACLSHHDAYDRQPEFWLPLMRDQYPEYAAVYAQPPFSYYLVRHDTND